MLVLLEDDNSLVAKVEEVAVVAEGEAEVEEEVAGVVVLKEQMSLLRILMLNWMPIMMRYEYFPLLVESCIYFMRQGGSTKHKAKQT